MYLTLRLQIPVTIYINAFHFISKFYLTFVYNYIQSWLSENQPSKNALKKAQKEAEKAAKKAQRKLEQQAGDAVSVYFFGGKMINSNFSKTGKAYLHRVIVMIHHNVTVKTRILKFDTPSVIGCCRSWATRCLSWLLWLIWADEVSRKSWQSVAWSWKAWLYMCWHWIMAQRSSSYQSC